MADHSALSQIAFSIFTFHLTSLDPISLPAYKGSTFRGGFGNAFKKIVCTLRRRTCRQCLLREKCVYSYVFETPPPAASEVMRKYKAAPHPFVIEPPPETKRLYAPGEGISFRLILIGRAVDYLPYFIYAFEELGKAGIGKGRGKYTLKAVHQGDSMLYSGETKSLQGGRAPLALRDLPRVPGQDGVGTLALLFETPTRIVFNGKLTLDIAFHMLIRSLLRRLSLLSYFHCEGEIDGMDFRGLIKKSEGVETRERDLIWHDWERYSARQDSRMKMGGFLGRLVFCGDLEEFIPFLCLGERLHVGKGTSFGLGKYRIVDPDARLSKRFSSCGKNQKGI